MDNALDIIEKKELAQRVKLTSTGIEFSGDLSFDEWENLGEFLQRAEQSVLWWIGDWLNYGEQSWGEMYSQAIQDQFRYSYTTLSHAKWVSSRIEFCRRLQNLSWGHHHEVAPLDIKIQDRFLDQAEQSDWSVRDLRLAIRDYKHQIKKQLPPPDGKYRVIYADPPWQYGNRLDEAMPGTTTPETYYPSMSLDELMELGKDVRQISDNDAVLFLWTTSPMLEDALVLIDAWGFDYKTSFIWDKVKHNFAHYNSMRHEFLLVATKGSCTPDEKTLFDSVQSIEKSNIHSQKPEQFREIIDTLYTWGNRIELFARQPINGWETWGNEI